jgi:citrate synthase
MSDTWKTAITSIKPNEIRVRGYRVDELMGARSFAEVVWLTWMGDLPDPKTAPLIEAILLASVDHGATPPSALTPRVVAGTGGNLSEALAGGCLSINAFHGGAIEGCMKALMRGVKLVRGQGLSHEDAAKQLLADLKDEGKRMPGFGHRVHKADPRTAQLRMLAQQGGVYGDHLKLADAIEAGFTAAGKELPLNVDGCVGAVLCELGVDPLIGNAFFILPRICGMVAHFAEERTREKVMRRIDQAAAEYDGPAPRDLPED